MQYSNESIDTNMYVTLSESYLLSLNDEPKKRFKNVYCVNCGEKGHIVKDCSGPITSFGILAFKIVYNSSDEAFDKNRRLLQLFEMIDPQKDLNKEKKYPLVKFLMIQRKDTMGYIDFVRGKYPEDEKGKREMINVCLNEMTKQEKQKLLSLSFDTIWKQLWIKPNSIAFRNEYDTAKKKFQQLDIEQLVENSDNLYAFSEWGLAKGRREMKESNIACAEREFFEETGYDKKTYEFIKNYPIIKEEFVGTNGVQYRHIYYLVKMKDNKGYVPVPYVDDNNMIQKGEVQNIGWFTLEECLSLIRPYDQAKKEVLINVHKDILEMNGEYACSNFYYHSTKFVK